MVKINVLVACEESQRVCIEFRKLGHEAYSCDIQECSGGHPEWHIQDDVLPLLNGCCSFTTVDGAKHTISGKWEMIIAHPPCTYLSNAGARHLFKGHTLNQERYENGLQAKEFFMALLNADCAKICVENPTPSKIYKSPQHSQIIQPWEHGHPYTKRTCLWLKGLQPLIPTNIVKANATWCPSGCSRFAGTNKNKGTKHSAKERAKTFKGIAAAMAKQWGGDISDKK